ncbi:MAG TPA: hypothetical protein DD456_11355 [Stenotrophomonas sp.]|nr:hypothetical protein [Stenotrophomonas sp.]
MPRIALEQRAQLRVAVGDRNAPRRLEDRRQHDVEVGPLRRILQPQARHRLVHQLPHTTAVAQRLRALGEPGEGKDAHAVALGDGVVVGGTVAAAQRLSAQAVPTVRRVAATGQQHCAGAVEIGRDEVHQALALGGDAEPGDDQVALALVEEHHAVGAAGGDGLPPQRLAEFARQTAADVLGQVDVEADRLAVRAEVGERPVLDVGADVEHALGGDALQHRPGLGAAASGQRDDARQGQQPVSHHR